MYYFIFKFQKSFENEESVLNVFLSATEIIICSSSSSEIEPDK